MAALRLLVVSDLHVDFPENRERARELARDMCDHAADALVVAGDLGHKLEQVEWTLGLFERFRGPRLFVPGNHDVWVVRSPPGSPRDSWEKLESLRGVCLRTGFHFLDSQNAKVAGFTFVGAMGWYDYSFANPNLGLDDGTYEGKKWGDLTYMDAHYAKWGAPDGDVAAHFTEDVRARLDAATDPVVFVSHHVPLEELVLRRGQPAWDFFNAYMGSKGLEDVLRRRRVTRFVFGHTHRPVTLVEPGRFVLNNPLGYPRQALNPRRAPFDVT